MPGRQSWTERLNMGDSIEIFNGTLPHIPKLLINSSRFNSLEPAAYRNACHLKNQLSLGL
jgi:hypothetical protein